MRGPDRREAPQALRELRHGALQELFDCARSIASIDGGLLVLAAFTTR